jgi:4-hydroxy-4-methyl-2-oxoglutarate aldolase
MTTGHIPQAQDGAAESPDDALAYLREASPAWVSDAQAVTNTMSPEMKPVWAGARLVGPAFTARCYPGSIITVHKALLEAPPGAVLVVDGGGDASSALFGELMATEAKTRGLAGIVVDGAVRDAEGLRDLAFPAFARGLTPRVGSNRRVGVTQIEVVCGGIVVHPGDLVVGGADGVVIIPAGRLSAVVGAVRAVEKKEADIRRRMRGGERLADILGMTGLIYPDGSRA